MLEVLLESNCTNCIQELQWHGPLLLPQLTDPNAWWVSYPAQHSIGIHLLKDWSGFSLKLDPPYSCLLELEQPYLPSSFDCFENALQCCQFQRRMQEASRAMHIPAANACFLHRFWERPDEAWLTRSSSVVPLVCKCFSSTRQSPSVSTVSCICCGA